MCKPVLHEAEIGLSVAGAQIVLLGSKMGSIGDGRTGGGLVRDPPPANRRLGRRVIGDQHVVLDRMQGGMRVGKRHLVSALLDMLLAMAVSSRACAIPQLLHTAGICPLGVQRTAMP